MMKTLRLLLVLIVAATLEAGGDAIVRTGLHAGSGGRRIALLGVGAVTLFGYGCFVNLSGTDFGKLLGGYVVVFFLVAQVIAWLGFGERPTLPVMVGGVLIVAGGLVLTFWKPGA